MYLLQGRLAPKYIPLEFNFSRKLIIKALGNSIQDEARVKKVFSEKGDAGIVAEYVIANATDIVPMRLDDDLEYKDQEYSISEVYDKLKSLAEFSGKGSQEEKLNEYSSLVFSSSAISARYITRMIIGELRLGISEKTLLDSLSWFSVGDKSLRKDLDIAFGYKADIGELGYLVLTSKNVKEDINKIEIKPGIPIVSKLVERENSPETVWERMPNCFVQPKLDGLRGQIHFADGKAHVFSRNMEDMTENFPDIAKSVSEIGVNSIILDSEIIGYDKENDRYLTYQETMQRRRKYDIDKYTTSIPVRAMYFDILYLNGEDLTRKPLSERMDILVEVMKDSDSNLVMLETKQMSDVEELQTYFQAQVQKGLEGIIAKMSDSKYEPGSRNYKWIKLKASSVSELVDTVDVAVLGYYTGRGQRAKFGVGALLTGVYDPETDTYFSVGKVGTGITDELFGKISQDLKPFEIESKPENVEVNSTLNPDVWVEPKVIIEIDADEITRSPNHTAAKGIKTDVPGDKPDRGLSLRFPRLKIWNRDKDIPTTVQELVKMYKMRKNKS
jgi:DNA ligase-1